MSACGECNGVGCYNAVNNNEEDEEDDTEDDIEDGNLFERLF